MMPAAEFLVGEIPSLDDGIRRGILSFGKYAGLTYEQALANDPEHCMWHADNVSEGDDAGIHFADWLAQDGRLAKRRKIDAVEEPLESLRLRTMDFGKFRDSGRSYEEVLASHPGYCKFLIEKLDNKPVGTAIRRFLTFVKQSGVDLDASIADARKSRRPAAPEAAGLPLPSP